MRFNFQNKVLNKCNRDSKVFLRCFYFQFYFFYLLYFNYSLRSRLQRFRSSLCDRKKEIGRRDWVQSHILNFWGLEQQLAFKSYTWQLDCANLVAWPFFPVTNFLVFLLQQRNSKFCLMIFWCSSLVLAWIYTYLRKRPYNTRYYYFSCSVRIFQELIYISIKY